MPSWLLRSAWLTSSGANADPAQSPAPITAITAAP